MAEVPEYFLVRVKTETGWQLVSCRSLTSINETRLPGDFGVAVSRAFEDSRKDDLQVIALPPIDDDRGWSALQVSIPIPRPIPRGD